eukprot:GHVS01090603.1.p1 GENE.GHVS01090603.1~~GHVS01090603.1.p1  ORF type:complete len:393 (+),score=61.41 GHVS01090603.1:1-1179(+)
MDQRLLELYAFGGGTTFQLISGLSEKSNPIAQPSPARLEVGRGRRGRRAESCRRKTAAAAAAEDNRKAVRWGVLEKASRARPAWKPRMVVLRGGALWYAKTSETHPDIATPSWICIPLRQCTQLGEVFEDKRVFSCGSGPRRYCWRAKSSNERDGWVLAVATEVAALREWDLLQEAEMDISREEFARSSDNLDFLERLSHLDGALAFDQTRDLIVDFIEDYHRNAERPWPSELFTLPDVRAHVQHMCSSRLEEAVEISEEGKERGNVQGDEKKQERWRCFLNAMQEKRLYGYVIRRQYIQSWLQHVLFPEFLDVPYVQNRIAQIVAIWSSYQSWPEHKPLQPQQPHHRLPPRVMSSPAIAASSSSRVGGGIRWRDDLSETDRLYFLLEGDSS